MNPDRRGEGRGRAAADAEAGPEPQGDEAEGAQAEPQVTEAESMTDVLDDLRERLAALVAANERLSVSRPDMISVWAVTEALDEFSAEHPGLVDLTVECGVCGRPTTEQEADRLGKYLAPKTACFPPPGWANYYWGTHLCPACAAEAGESAPKGPLYCEQSVDRYPFECRSCPQRETCAEAGEEAK